MELRIGNNHYPFLATGSQGVVFYDEIGNRVFKVFKSYNALDAIGQNAFNEEEFNTSKVSIFESEQEAYALIAGSDIQDFFPHCHDPVTIDTIVDENGTDISNLFLLDCVLTLDWIPGACYKNNDPRAIKFYTQNNINLGQIFESLENIGVRFYTDSNVICHNNTITIIDIATEDFANFQPPPQEPRIQI